MTYSTLLVNLEAGRPNTHLLHTAREVAERFQSGIIGIAACQPLQMLYGDGYAYGDVLEQDGKDIARDVAATEAEFRAALQPHLRHVEWRAAYSVLSLSAFVASEARRADLILTPANPAGAFNANRQTHTGDLIMTAGRPVLIVTPAPVRLDRVLLAWKDTRETRRAADDALPLLRRASHVSVVELAEPSELAEAQARLKDVAAWLATHGIEAECVVSATTGADAQGLSAIADEHGAGVIVAGAYGHSRLREWALGGVTRAMLAQEGRASFLSH